MPSKLMSLSSCVALSLLVGCPDRNLSEVIPYQDVVELKEIKVNQNRQIDVLFVIDNSNSMLANQQNLTANFASFIAVLEAIPDGTGGTSLPDIHIGVVTSDVGGPGGRDDDGTLQTQRHTPSGTSEVISDCAMLHDGALFLSDIADPAAPGARLRNYDGTLRDAFECIASVGTKGAGLEAHLESARRALTKAKGGAGNAGFWRDDAYLAVVLIADEDDCSPPIGDNDPDVWDASAAELGTLESFRCFEYGVTCDQDVRPAGATSGPDPVVEVTGCVPSADGSIVANIDDHIEFMRGLKANPRDIIIATIIGNSDPVTIGRVGGTGPNQAWFSLKPSCQVEGSTITARPGIRLDAFRQAFIDRNYGSTICNDDLTDALVGIATTFERVLGNPCMKHPPTDRNPTVDGVQAECSVSFTVDDSAPTTLAPCDDSASNTPCWQIIVDQDSCPGDEAGHLAIEFVWDGEPPTDAVVAVQCATTAPADADNA